MDLVIVIMATPIAVPLMLCIGAFIKAVSPGPVFFRQDRIGMSGHKFRCWKFRTMHHNASTDGHSDYLKTLIKSDKPMTKLDAEDKRLIRGARWLRSSGLDELPQIFNVLAGEMSFVGPRPGTVQEYAEYTDAHKGRLETLPGLTGLWQVSGKNDTTFDQMIALDVQYARNLSLWLDLKIIAKTPLVLSKQCQEIVAKRRRTKRSNPQGAKLSGVNGRSTANGNLHTNIIPAPAHAPASAPAPEPAQLSRERRDHEMSVPVSL